MERQAVFSKGTKFIKPGEVQGYELARDVYPGEPFCVDDFTPINGAPKPVGGEIIPQWLADQIKDRMPNS